jgi:dihydrofolate reductase
MNLDAAFAFAGAEADKRGVSEIMVIGGGDVFEEAMAVADRLEITRVHTSPEGDSYFPDIDMSRWRETRREKRLKGPYDDADFTVLTYQRNG